MLGGSDYKITDKQHTNSYKYSNVCLCVNLSTAIDLDNTASIVIILLLAPLLAVTLSFSLHLAVCLSFSPFQPMLYLLNPASVTALNAKALPRQMIKVSSQFKLQCIDLMFPNLPGLYLTLPKALRKFHSIPHLSLSRFHCPLFFTYAPYISLSFSLYLSLAKFDQEVDQRLNHQTRT